MKSTINTRKLLSEVKFFESYSRYKKDEGKYETWEESVKRVMDTHREFYKDKLGNPELVSLIDYAEKAYKNQVVLGSQRMLQYGGEQILKHNMRQFNCVYGPASRPDFFGEYFYILLCGAGCGSSVQKHHIAQLPMVRPRTKQTKEHIITDDIEGWATALDVLMSSFFIGGGKYPEYEGRKVHFNYNKIRDKNAPISGGFLAPGPEPLMHCLNMVERLLTRIADEGILRPIHVYDICMFVADAVLSGGVRRSATIFLFSLDDEEMMNAKVGNWLKENPQRARSNNSAVILRSELTYEILEKMIEKTRQFGEPGIFIVESKEYGYNPCGEIGFFPYFQHEDGTLEAGFQGCNLNEINGNLCKTKENFLEACRVAGILGTLQAGYTNFKFVSEVTKKIFDREALLGVSLTGWMNNPDVLFDPETLEEGARIVKEMNAKVAKMIGINPAARTTCVKPSGNASVLLQSASGIHAEHAPRYIRNAQINKSKEVSTVIKKNFPYMVEESVWSTGKTDYVISFPVIAPENSLFKKDLTAVQFLEHVKTVQKHWVMAGNIAENAVDPGVNNNVSNTVLVGEDEWEEVMKFIYDNNEFYTGISLLPKSGDKDYYQAPFIEVLTPEEIVDRYGEASLFASGLIVDATTGFNNLWEAISIARYNGDESNQEMKDIRSDWIRRFHKFAANYFDGDARKTEYCLKDVAMLHKWAKIQNNMKEIHLEDELKEMKLIDVDTMGAMSCHAGQCEI